MHGWVLYVDWSSTLCEVKLVRVNRPAASVSFIETSTVLNSSWKLGFHTTVLVPFHDALKYNFEVCWMMPFLFEVSLVRLPAKSDSLRCVMIVTRVRLQCGSLIAFLFDEKGLTKSLWPPCALGLFKSLSKHFLYYYDVTIWFTLWCL